MLKSVEAETMPPNAWLWSMISSCSNKEDIKLLFQILQKLRVFVSSFVFLKRAQYFSVLFWLTMLVVIVYFVCCCANQLSTIVCTFPHSLVSSSPCEDSYKYLNFQGLFYLLFCEEVSSSPCGYSYKYLNFQGSFICYSVKKCSFI